MGRVRIAFRRVLPTLTVLACAFSACTAEPDFDAVFAQAEEYASKREWEAAEPLIREAIMLRPDHPGAHYLFARFYLWGVDPWPFLAEGELMFAERLFKENGDRAGMTMIADEEFLGEIAVDRAVIPLRRVQLAAQHGLNTALIQQHLETFRNRMAEARRMTKDSKRLDRLEARLQNFLDYMRSPDSQANPDE